MTIKQTNKSHLTLQKGANQNRLMLEGACHLPRVMHAELLSEGVAAHL